MRTNRSMTAVVALTSVALLFGGTTFATPLDTSTTPSADELRNKDWIKNGRSRFVRTCAYCHGNRGEGGKNVSFQERENWDPSEIFTTISEGRISGANAMPPWKDSFTKPEIWELVAYIKSLSKDFPGPLDGDAPASKK